MSGGFICRDTPAKVYTTTWPLTENPVSEGGVWAGPPTDWTVLASDGAVAYDTQTSTSGYQDSKARYVPGDNWGPNQEVELTLSVTNFGAMTDPHELEALFRITWDYGNNLIVMYEALIGVQNAIPYAALVRHRGAMGASFNSPAGAVFGATIDNGLPASWVSGDKIRWTMIGTTATLYHRPIATGIESLLQTYVDNDATYKIDNGGLGCGLFWRITEGRKDLAIDAVTVRGLS